MRRRWQKGEQPKNREARANAPASPHFRTKSLSLLGPWRSFIAGTVHVVFIFSLAALTLALVRRVFPPLFLIGLVSHDGLQ